MIAGDLPKIRRRMGELGVDHPMAYGVGKPHIFKLDRRWCFVAQDGPLVRITRDYVRRLRAMEDQPADTLHFGRLP